MKFHAQQLGIRLISIIQFAKSSTIEDINIDKLAEEIADFQRDEFSYYYRANSGEIIKGYFSPSTISKYIRFAQFLGDLNENLRSEITEVELTDDEKMFNHFSDMAKDILSENGIEINEIISVSEGLLKNDSGDLPTLEDIYESVSPDLAKWKFKWLVYLYTLGESSLLRFVLTPLLLSRKYAKGR